MEVLFITEDRLKIINTLIDLALDTRDKELFDELVKRKTKGYDLSKEEIFEKYIEGELRAFKYEMTNEGHFIYVIDEAGIQYVINLSEFNLYCTLKYLLDLNNNYYNDDENK